MTTVEILRAARKKITPLEMWGQGGAAVGGHAGPLCAALAISHVATAQRDARLAKRALIRAIGSECTHTSECSCGISIWVFNDSHTHAEVLAAFDRAIANEEAKEAEFVGVQPAEELVGV